ncbi:hypothetical protein Tcan_02190 [Toxocara canis]|uniref:Uncharacterized protein n=1 Tax=Toxocara canis TaxID=6265 RepID=A0A0B2UQ70_TOXCA|nr:hypothetical protein Tcan_02190 [Toxocara canis]
MFVRRWHATLEEIRHLGRVVKKKESKKKALKKKLEKMANAQTKKLPIEERRRLAEQTEDEEENYDGMPLEIEEKLKSGAFASARKRIEAPLRLLREGIKLGMMIANRSIDGFENKTLKVASPRILSIVPAEENNDEVEFLSPSLFSLHHDGQGVEKLLSIPNVLGSTNLMSNTDQEGLMDFIVEASGVSDAVKKAYVIIAYYI